MRHFANPNHPRSNIMDTIHEFRRTEVSQRTATKSAHVWFPGENALLGIPPSSSPDLNPLRTHPILPADFAVHYSVDMARSDEKEVATGRSQHEWKATTTKYAEYITDFSIRGGRAQIHHLTSEPYACHLLFPLSKTEPGAAQV